MSEHAHDEAETALFLHLMSAAGRPPVVTGLFGEQICLACELQWQPCIAHRPEPVSPARGIPQFLPAQRVRALTPAEILQRYGTPEAAWANWATRSSRWYSGPMSSPVQRYTDEGPYRRGDTQWK